MTNIEIDTGFRSHFPVGRGIQITDPRPTPGYDHPASARSPGGIGLGDIFARLTRWSGMHALWQLRTRKTGKPCGCGKRRAKLNRIRFQLPISYSR